jgi:TP901 family phage tail tape measure protein|nr:MAG TPA: minor tail protein [Caudoviricetes sp.]
MAIFKVTAVPDFSQLKGEIAKLQSSPVTLGVNTQNADVQINATRQSLQKLTETFSPEGELRRSVADYSRQVGEVVQVSKSLNMQSGEMEITSKKVTQNFTAQAKAAERAAAQVRAAKDAYRAYAAQQSSTYAPTAMQSRIEDLTGVSGLSGKSAKESAAVFEKAYLDASGKVQQSTKNAAQSVRSVGTAAKESSGFADLMGDSFVRVAGKMALWQVMGNAIAGLKRSFTEALETMKDVDDEMVTIRKVTGATTEELNRIEKQAYDTASAYGVAADEYLNSVANFSRAGYGEQASALAELATKTQIVGDTDAETAQQFLLSMDAAYKYQGSIEQLTKVLDGANEIDNNYATSIEKIAEGLGKVAPIAAQAHVGADELTAAIGTITAVTQRSGTEAATALRALFLNIIGDTKTEIDEGVTWTTGEIAGLRDVIKLYAKDAYDAAQASGDVINPMKAIAGLSQSMKDGFLTEQQLMEMVSDIGGKLRTSQLLALIQNWDMYESMLGDYADAVGSADKEVENALDSWTRKTEILHNKWTEFISHLVETDTIKGALDQVIALVEFLDSDTGRLVIQLGLLVGVLTLANKGFTALMNSGVGTFFGTLTSAIGGNAMAITQLTGQMKGLLAMLPKLGIGAAIFAALAVAISLSTEKARAYEKALKGVETAQSALGETEDEYDTLISKTGELTEAEEKRLEVLRAIREEQEKAVRDAESEAWDAWNELHGTGAEVYVGGGDSVGNGMGVTPIQMVQADVESLARYKASLKLVQDQMEAGTKTQEEYYYSLSKLQEGREEEVETIRKAINYGFAVSEEQRQLVAAYDRVQEILGVTQKATQDYVNKLISEAQQAGYTGKALYDLVAAQITASNTKLNFSQQISALRTLAATIGYTTQAYGNLLNAGRIYQQAMVLVSNKKFKTLEEAQSYLTNKAWGKLTGTAPSGGWNNTTGNTGGYSGGGSGGSGSSAAKKKYQDEIDALEKQRDAELAAIDAQIDALKKQNEEIDRAEKLEELRLEVMRKQDALLNARNERTVRMYNAESGQWEWIADPEKVKKAEEDLADAKKDLRDYEREMELDLAIEELEARKKAIEAAYQLKIDALEEYINALGETVAQEEVLLDQSVQNWWEWANGVLAAKAAAAGVTITAGGTPVEVKRNATGNASGYTEVKVGNLTGVRKSTKSEKASVSNKPTGNLSDAISMGKNNISLPNSGKSNRKSIVSGSIIGAVSGGRKKKYDSGGVLHGLGGIKATVDDEMVLPPDVTAKMLKPSADARFRARVNELGGLYGETPVSRSVAGSSDNRSYSDHSGPTYNVKGITLTEQQAEHLTVAQMCRMAHNVKPYGG